MAAKQAVDRHQRPCWREVDHHILEVGEKGRERLLQPLLGTDLGPCKFSVETISVGQIFAGALIPGLKIKAFDFDDVAAAEAWLNEDSDTPDLT